MQDEIEAKAQEWLESTARLAGPHGVSFDQESMMRLGFENGYLAALRQRPVDRPDFYYKHDPVYGHCVLTVSEYESWGRHCRKEDAYSPAYLSPVSTPQPVVDDARMARALEWVRDVAQGMPASSAK